MKDNVAIIVIGTWLMLASASLYADEQRNRPIVGAVRWDAWHGPASEVGLTVEKTLAPKRWHYRLPFYAKVIGENAVEVRANTQAIMDQEIDHAGNAGLDYWAFVVYPEEYALSLGLKLYLSSEKKHRVNFCLDLQGGWEARGGGQGLAGEGRPLCAVLPRSDLSDGSRRAATCLFVQHRGIDRRGIVQYLG